MKEIIEKLTKKIGNVVENYKKLQKENEDIKVQLLTVREEKEQLEKSLLREHDTLVEEKDSIKGAVEALLENISKIEASKE